MIPDWIPNIHPFIVHFPIALLVTAVLFDLAKLLYNNHNWLQKATFTLYSVGTAGLFASFLSGRQAVDTVTISGDATPVVTSHEDWALYTLIYFTLFTLLRAWNLYKNTEANRGVLSGMIILAFIGTGLLWNTGEKGAKLVYHHGIAVGEIGRLEQQVETLQQELATFRREAGPELGETGSWTWRIGAGAARALTRHFELEGFQNITAETEREDGRYHLELPAGPEPSYFVIGETLGSIEGRIELNVSDFEGSVMLVHHYRNPDNYQYLKLEGNQLLQGQMINGSDNLLGSGRISPDSWFTLRVTTSGQHYYGYHNQQTVVHTHSDELEPGKTGFAMSGEGRLKIRMVEFNSVN